MMSVRRGTETGNITLADGVLDDCNGRCASNLREGISSQQSAIGHLTVPETKQNLGIHSFASKFTQEIGVYVTK